MSYLILDKTYRRLTFTELREVPLEVNFRQTQKRIIVDKIMPHLYICGSPIGSILLELRNGNTTVWSQSQSISSIISECGKTKTNYHGHISFVDFPVILEKDKIYTLRLSGESGYIFSAEHHVGWVRPPVRDEPYRFHNPLGFKIVEIRNA